MAAQPFSLILATFSGVVVLVGAYTAIEIARRVRFNEGRRRIRWAYVGALALALAIWSADLTGTLSLQQSLPVWFDPLLVFASFVAALVAGGAVFFLVIRAKRSRALLALASLLVVASILGTHYATMMAMQTSGALARARPDIDFLRGSLQVGLIISIGSIVLLALAVAATRFERWNIATRNRFENLLELAPQIFWFADPTGGITYCNHYWYNYTGLSERDTIGFAWTNALHPDDRESVIDDWSDAVREGKHYESELRLRGADGGYCWFLVRSRPTRDESTRGLASLSTSSSGSERKMRLSPRAGQSRSSLPA
jgi:PAS domain S-box-containing protein